MSFTPCWLIGPYKVRIQIGSVLACSKCEIYLCLNGYLPHLHPHGSVHRFPLLLFCLRVQEEGRAGSALLKVNISLIRSYFSSVEYAKNRADLTAKIWWIFSYIFFRFAPGAGVAGAALGDAGI
jgi:hypothetical protein